MMTSSSRPPFSLVYTPSLPQHTANRYAISLSKLVAPSVTPGTEHDIRFIFVENYMFDIPWLRGVCPQMFTASEGGVIVHGDPPETAKSNAAALPGGYSFSKPDLLPYGTHHTKMIIVFYSSTVRIAIMTANLIAMDWNYMTQGVWYQDFPLKTTDSPATSPFEVDLSDYLRELARPYGRRGCPDVEKVRTRLLAYDCTSANVKLVACVPGYHKGSELSKYGHIRMRALLEQEALTVPSSHNHPTLICQYSSQGSVSEDWLAGEFTQSLSPPHRQAGKLATGRSHTPTIQLVWPRVEDVRNSLDGWYAGGSLPGNTESVMAPAVRNRHHRWDGSVSGRQRAMPHMKSFLAYSTHKHNPADSNSVIVHWCYVGSCNLSRAAWGALQKKGTQLMIRSYELGVLFLPSFYAAQCHLPAPITFTLAYPTSTPTSSSGSGGAGEVDDVSKIDHDSDDAEEVMVQEAMKRSLVESSALITPVVHVVDSDDDTEHEIDDSEGKSDERPSKVAKRESIVTTPTPTPTATLTTTGPAYKVVTGDILTYPSSFLVHQCNCHSTHGRGLAKAIFDKFPHANVYARRKVPSTPGEIEIVGGPGTPERGVINLFAQVYPSNGRPQDSASDRARYFAKCLSRVREALTSGRITAREGLSFPWHIGCGLAGGDWGRYSDILSGFAANITVPVYIVQLPSESSSTQLQSNSTTPTITPSPVPVPVAIPVISGGSGGSGAVPHTVDGLTSVVDSHVVLLPLPYAIPPPAYTKADEPWAVNVPRNQLDVFGRTWGL